MIDARDLTGNELLEALGWTKRKHGEHGGFTFHDAAGAEVCSGNVFAFNRHVEDNGLATFGREVLEIDGRRAFVLEDGLVRFAGEHYEVPRPRARRARRPA